MVYYNFSDFASIKSRVDTHAVYLSIMDVKLHIIDFSIETQLRTKQDIYLFCIGSKEKALTTYNTLKNCEVKIYDNYTNDYIVTNYKDWSSFFIFDTNIEKLVLKDVENEIFKVTVDWLKPEVLFKELYKTDNYIVFNLEVCPYRSDVTKEYMITYKDKIAIFDNIIHYIGIQGNHFKAFKQIAKDILNVDLDINDMQKCINKRYPDIDIKKGVYEEYWELLRLFSNPIMGISYTM